MEILPNNIYNMDCIEGMKLISDKSIDLILTDPPYNISKDKRWDKWKTIEKYIEFMGTVFLELQRVLKDSGSMYFFHNDFLQIVELQNFLNKSTIFRFNSFITLNKPNFRNLSWKNCSENNNLRSWFNTCEYLLYYTFQDKTGLDKVMLDTNNFSTLRGYFKDLQEYIGLNIKQINSKLGNRKGEHCFYLKTTQWDLCTLETYQQLIDVFDIDKWTGFREYESLRQEYESLRQEYESLRYIHNLDKNHNNVWQWEFMNNGNLHPCEKPINIIERIIKTSSNETDLILDPFLGSGTTAVACIQTNRQYIGFELLPEYFQIAQKRIDKAIADEETLFNQ